MSEKMGNTFVIEQTEPQLCEYCGQIAELRPYGKNGANICYKCGHNLENLEETNRRCRALIDSSNSVVLNI